MEDIFNRISKSEKFDENTKYYWGYQYKLGKECLLPYLVKNNAFRPGYSVAEIGSAEGGVLAGLVEAGAVDALGTDISVTRLELGERICIEAGINIKFMAHDIVGDKIPQDLKGKYDLLILRDVIEHLDDTKAALENMRALLKTGGSLYVTFPPYYSPFGGHQHTLANLTGKLPYIHLLPDFIFNMLISTGRKADIGEVTRLRSIRLTPGKFLNAAKSAGYNVLREDYYLLRQVYKFKFGLPSVKISKIGFLPFVRNLISLEAAYILKAK